MAAVAAPMASAVKRGGAGPAVSMGAHHRGPDRCAARASWDACGRHPLLRIPHHPQAAFKEGGKKGVDLQVRA